MKKILFVAVLFSAFGLSARTQSQTMTANLFNWNGNPYMNLWAQEGSQYVAADDDAYAYSKKLSPKRSALLLVLQDFHFDIPVNATIQDITVRVRRFKTGKGSIHDYFATLLVAGSSFYNPNPYGVRWMDQTNYPATESEFLYTENGAGSNGGVNANVAYAWTPAMINDPAFGVRIDTDKSSGSVTVFYDLVDITVNYTLPVTSRKSPAAAETKLLKEPVVYPNPFTSKAIIQFTAAEDGNAVVDLYSISGVKIQALFSGKVIQGQVYKVTVGQSLLPKGIYVYSVSNGKQKYTGRMIKME